MIVYVYGMEGCERCKSAEDKIKHFLDRWGVDDVEVCLLDMEGDEYAAAEADFFDVFETPTVMVMQDEWTVLGRWDGKPPHSEELKRMVMTEQLPSAAA